VNREDAEKNVQARMMDALLSLPAAALSLVPAYRLIQVIKCWRLSSLPSLLPAAAPCWCWLSQAQHGWQAVCMLWPVQELQHCTHQGWLQPHVDEPLPLLLSDMQVGDELVNGVRPANK
jgi:hypothetical protein